MVSALITIAHRVTQRLVYDLWTCHLQVYLLGIFRTRLEGCVDYIHTVDTSFDRSCILKDTSKFGLVKKLEMSRFMRELQAILLSGCIPMRIAEALCSNGFPIGEYFKKRSVKLD